jgi:hypothetical protein
LFFSEVLRTVLAACTPHSTEGCENSWIPERKGGSAERGLGVLGRGLDAV